MALKKLRKQPAESRLYDFDFANKLLGGATIVAVTDILAVGLGKVPNASSLTISQIAHSATRAQARIAGGTAREDYKVTALVVDSNQNTLECDGILQVREE